MTSRKVIEQADVYCDGCLKYDRAHGRCIAYAEFYFLWTDECKARETSPYKWLRTLEEIQEYGGRPTILEFRAATRAKEKANAQADKEIKQVYYEESHGREVKKKGGGGEKTDRTHKLFSRERMKDNRPIYPWKGFPKGRK